jgi:hypothetical protein
VSSAVILCVDTINAGYYYELRFNVKLNVKLKEALKGISCDKHSKSPFNWSSFLNVWRGKLWKKY